MHYIRVGNEAFPDRPAPSDSAMAAELRDISRLVACLDGGECRDDLVERLDRLAEAIAAARPDQATDPIEAEDRQWRERWASAYAAGIVSSPTPAPPESPAARIAWTEARLRDLAAAAEAGSPPTGPVLRAAANRLRAAMEDLAGPGPGSDPESAALRRLVAAAIAANDALADVPDGPEGDARTAADRAARDRLVAAILRRQDSARGDVAIATAGGVIATCSTEVDGLALVMPDRVIRI